MAGSKPRPWILYILGGMVASVLLSMILLAIIRGALDSSGRKGLVASATSLALGHSLKVDEKMFISS